MRPIDKARIVAKEYKENVRELETIRENQNLKKNNSSGIPIRSGKISKPTEAEVMERLDNERLAYLEKATGAVDYALGVVIYKDNGDITKQLFEMVYRDKTHKLYGAAHKLHISERTAKRYNRYFLKLVAVAMGYQPTQ